MATGSNRREWDNPDQTIQQNASDTAKNNLATANAALRASGYVPINELPNSGTGTGSTSFSITPRESAYAQLDQEMIRLFGRKATATEKSQFYIQLNKAERQYASRGTGTSSTNYLFDKGAFINQYVVGLAQGEIQAGKDLGGQSGDLFRNIKSYADKMGIPLSDSGALDAAFKVISGEKDETSIMEDFRKRAISLYGGLADRLNQDPTLTVREAADDYIQLMSKYLDLNPNNISLFDSTLTKAINFIRDGKPATKTISEFVADLRNDDRFQYGTMAHEEARNLGSSLARMMS